MNVNVCICDSFITLEWSLLASVSRWRDEASRCETGNFCFCFLCECVCDDSHITACSISLSVCV